MPEIMNRKLKSLKTDFVTLMECFDRIPNRESLQVSFGMSDDFEEAVSKIYMQLNIWIHWWHSFIDTHRLWWEAPLWE